MSKHRVFVYGTLKRGFPNHHYMHEAEAAFIGTARTVDAYPLIIGGQWFSPNLLPERGQGHRVAGEIWEVGEAGLAILDALESVHLPTGYHRQTIPVEMAGGGIEQALVYFRERRHIAIVHTDPLDDYQDRRYVAADDRD